MVVSRDMNRSVPVGLRAWQYFWAHLICSWLRRLRPRWETGLHHLKLYLSAEKSEESLHQRLTEPPITLTSPNMQMEAKADKMTESNIQQQKESLYQPRKGYIQYRGISCIFTSYLPCLSELRYALSRLLDLSCNSKCHLSSQKEFCSPSPYGGSFFNRKAGVLYNFILMIWWLIAKCVHRRQLWALMQEKGSWKDMVLCLLSMSKMFAR